MNTENREVFQLICGDALTVLRTLTAESVQCCVTSPPYWNLRDYGVEGQMGLESTPQEYVEKMVELFREVRRVMRDDGTLFLNLGDSYFSNPGNGRGGGSTLAGGKPHLSGSQRVRGHGIAGKVFPDLKCRDCASGNPCDAHRDSWLRRISRTCDHHALAQAVELLLRIRASITELPGHLPIWDSTHQQATSQSASAILDSLQTSIREVEPLLSLLVSTLSESSRQPPADFLLSHTISACLLSLRSFAACARPFLDRLDAPSRTFDCRAGIGSPYGELAIRSQCTSESCSTVFSLLEHIQAQSSICQLKPKDLIGIPWMIAFALRDDGWYLRSDIVWNKPNPMPESVTDRPTRSHEYIFLFSKSSRYFYDYEAIKDPPSPALIQQIEEGYNGKSLKDYIGANVQDASATKGRIINGYRNRIDKQRGHSRRHAGFNDKWDALTHAEQALCGRNKRDVWTVPPANYSETHFATFPPDLIKPCILAGCPLGGTVLDPFAGTFTTGMVAIELGRKAIGIELNPKYCELARQRCNITPGLPL